MSTFVNLILSFLQFSLFISSARASPLVPTFSSTFPFYYLLLLRTFPLLSSRFSSFSVLLLPFFFYCSPLIHYSHLFSFPLSYYYLYFHLLYTDHVMFSHLYQEATFPILSKLINYLLFLIYSCRLHTLHRSEFCTIDHFCNSLAKNILHTLCLANFDEDREKFVFPVYELTTIYGCHLACSSSRPFTLDREELLSKVTIIGKI